MINTAKDFKQNSGSLWTVVREAWKDLKTAVGEAFGQRERSDAMTSSGAKTGPVNHSVSRLKGWAFLHANVLEDDRSVVIRIDAPAMRREDFSIEGNERALKVRGVRRVNQQLDAGRWQISNIAYGSFCRYFAFPSPVRMESCSAVYRDGVLRIEIQKQEKSSTRRIQIAS